MVDIESVIHRMKNLREWQIVTTVPDEFDFRGTVPFDMHIKDGVATVKVWALNVEEATSKVTNYFQGEY